MEIRESEVLRYLGYRGSSADELVSGQIKEVKAELEYCVTPKSVYGKWECKVDSAGTVEIGGRRIGSNDLAAHIKDCGQVILFAATLGTEADSLIRRYSIADIGKAAVMQAVCTAMIERYCDDLERQITAEVARAGLYTRSRFSPGYGDFSITHQKDIINLLDCGRWIGLTLADSFMMIPTKSVTALIGLTRVKNHSEGKCKGCSDLQCEFREE